MLTICTPFHTFQLLNIGLLKKSLLLRVWPLTNPTAEPCMYDASCGRELPKLACLLMPKELVTVLAVDQFQSVL